MVSDRSNGIYRGVVAAFIGLALIGASEPPKAAAQSHNNATSSAVKSQSAPANPATPEQAIPQPPDKGCEKDNDRRNSDLCAQWKAADAASDAASAAWYQFWVAIAGLILGGLTMAAAVAAANYAKRAAIATERTVDIAQKAASEAGDALRIAGQNADAAQRLADLSETNSRHQLRSYVVIEGIGYVSGEMFGSEIPCLMVRVANHGQTPAHILKIAVKISWLVPAKQTSVILDESENTHPSIIMHGNPTDNPFSLGIHPDRIVGRGIITVKGVVFYSDCFGKMWKTKFGFATATEMFGRDIPFNTSLGIGDMKFEDGDQE